MIGFLLDSIKGLSTANSATIDNHVFRLHYIFTSSILLTASTVLISNQLFGDPIDCISDGSFHKEEALKNTIDSFCWVAATYTVEDLLVRKKDSRYVIYDGVGLFDPQSQYQKQNFQLYYRWVFFLFFVQAIVFYIPHYFWKSWESGKMAGLSKTLDCPVEPTLDRDRYQTRIALLLDALEACDVNSHNWYTYRFYCCEVLNFILLILNFIVTNQVLDYKFLPSGYDMMRNGLKSSTVLSKLFPIHAKCLWRTSGPSGSIQENDALCVLPLNSFNRMAFTFLWFWYIFVGIATAGWLIFRLATIVFRPIRASFLRWKGNSIQVGDHDHHTKSGDCYDFICKEIPHEDWFVLYQLADNLDSSAFQSIIVGLCERLSYQKGVGGRRFTCPILASDIVSNSKPSKEYNVCT